MKASEKASLILQERRRENRRRQEAAIKEVYDKIPKIRALDKLIKQVGFESIRLAAEGLDQRQMKTSLKI